MRKYQVWLNGMDRFVELEADDLNVEATGGVAFWNFIIFGSNRDDVTVAAFPFDGVAYVISPEG
jgi:hypothetical protein